MVSFTDGTVSKLSLRQAAEWAGTTKPTVLKHMQAGKVSAEKDGDGRWWFDVSELRRAYGEPKTRTVSGTGSEETDLNTLNHPGLQPETAGSTELIEELRSQIEELRTDKTDLRRRLDEREEAARENERRLLTVIEKQAEQVKLLTDQRTPDSAPRSVPTEPVAEPQQQPPALQPSRGFLRRLFGG
jgi:hypothetical protein